jgi:polar amino acid transport system substrate-binding protein
MKKLVLALAFAAMSGLSTQAADKLVIGTEGAYPPFNFVDSAGKVGGFDIDIGLALCAEMKVECTVVTQDWDGIIPALQAKKFDFMIASMFITPERAQKVAFTKSYYKAPMTHIAPKGANITEFTNDALKGKTIGAQAGTTQAEYATAMYPDANIKLYPTQDEVNIDMVNGRLDLEVGDMLPMMAWLNGEDGKCCELIGKPIGDEKYIGQGAGIAVRLEDKELLAKLNTAIDALRANGIYQKINAKYFPIDIYDMK